jgi:hypothetical protein
VQGFDPWADLREEAGVSPSVFAVVVETDVDRLNEPGDLFVPPLTPHPMEVNDGTVAARIVNVVSTQRLV